MPETVVERQGMFGAVRCVVNESSLSVWINDQLEGSVASVPAADVVDPSLSGPGPVALSRYVFGWLLPVLGTHAQTGLMVGLGSGAGVVSVLYLVPSLRITVVEIDPTITEVVRECFPLLSWYEQQRRLHIIHDDIRSYLATLRRAPDVYDVVWCDPYTGKPNEFLHAPWLPHVFPHAIDVVANVIAKPGDGRVETIVDAFQLFSAPKQAHVFETYPGSASYQNWMVTTSVSPAVVTDDLYVDLPPYPSVVNARLAWRAFQSQCPSS